MNAFLNRLQRLIARWRLAVWLAVKLRNQCAAVIAYSLAQSPDPDANGERWLIQTLGAGVRTFVDVGAHRGEWTERVLRHAGDARGLLFEPNPDCLPALRSRFEGHRAVEVCPQALGAEAGERPFVRDGQRSRLATADRVGAGVVTVGVTTLDREISRRGWPAVDLLKIDAEGHDLHILRGAAALLAAQRIGIVQFEYGDQWPAAGATLLAALQFLAGQGYEAYLLRPDALEATRYETWGEHFSYSNYVAVSPGYRALAERCIRR